MDKLDFNKAMDDLFNKDPNPYLYGLPCLCCGNNPITKQHKDKVKAAQESGMNVVGTMVGLKDG